MLIALAHMSMRFFRFHFDILDRRFLLHYSGIDVLEQLSEFDHLALNLLDGLVAALDGPKSGLRLPTAVALKKLNASWLK